MEDSIYEPDVEESEEPDPIEDRVKEIMEEVEDRKDIQKDLYDQYSSWIGAFIDRFAFMSIVISINGVIFFFLLTFRSRSHSNYMIGPEINGCLALIFNMIASITVLFIIS